MDTNYTVVNFSMSTKIEAFECYIEDVIFGSIIRYNNKEYIVVDVFGTELYKSSINHSYICNMKNGDLIGIPDNTKVEVVKWANPEDSKIL